MAKSGGSPPIFDGLNFGYWKARMGAYLDAIAPEVWHATKVGFTGELTSDNVKWNAKARNALIEAISDDVFARVDGIDTAHGIWKQLIEMHEGSSKLREQKYHMLKAKYDDFKKLANESYNEMYSRVNIIVKDINAFDVSTLEKGSVNRKILKLLPKPKYNIINTILQKENLDTMEVVELVGEIRAHEMDIHGISKLPQARQEKVII